MSMALFSNEFIFKSATQAIEDILSNTDQVLMGNGVNSYGELYPDVKVGLTLALQIIKQLEEENTDV